MRAGALHHLDDVQAFGQRHEGAFALAGSDTRPHLLGLVVIAVAVVSMWFNLRAEIKDLSRGLESINKRLDHMESAIWQPVDDYVFMEKYTQVNNLKMPEHKGAN